MTRPGCHPAFTLQQLGKAPADPCEPELRNKQILKLAGWILMDFDAAAIKSLYFNVLPSFK